MHHHEGLVHWHAIQLVSHRRVNVADSKQVRTSSSLLRIAMSTGTEPRLFVIFCCVRHKKCHCHKCKNHIFTCTGKSHHIRAYFEYHTWIENMWALLLCGQLIVYFRANCGLLSSFLSFYYIHDLIRRNVGRYNLSFFFASIFHFLLLRCRREPTLIITKKMSTRYKPKTKIFTHFFYLRHACSWLIGCHVWMQSVEVMCLRIIHRVTLSSSLGRVGGHFSCTDESCLQSCLDRGRKIGLISINMLFS